MELHNATLWESIADAIPDAPALIHGDRTVSWREFDDRAARLATALSARGVSLGTKVAINLHNGPEWLESFFALLKMRAVPVSVNYRYTGHELGYLLANSDAEVIIFHRGLGGRVAAAIAAVPAVRTLVAVDDGSTLKAGAGVLDYEALLATHGPAERITRSPDDVMMFYTGGTTGPPKGIITPIGAYTDVLEMSAGQFRALAFAGAPFDPPTHPVDAARSLHEQGRSIRALAASPLMHSTAIGLLAAPALRAGGAVVTLERRPFDPHEFLDTVERRRVTVTALVGDAFARPIVQALEEEVTPVPCDTSSLRMIFSAGVVFSADSKHRLLARMPGATIVEYCGSSEGAFIGWKTVRHGDIDRTGVFTAGPGLKILDADGRPLPPGAEQSGPIASPTGMLGYYKDPEKTAEHFREIDGVLHIVTGDHAVLRSDGSVLLLGRGSSVINTGGEKVFPDEVEDVVKSLPGVIDCIVVGQSDERLGQRVAAVVEVSAGHPDADAIRATVRTRLAGFKVPRTIVFAAVPRLANGKPALRAAQKLVADARDGSSQLGVGLPAR